MSESRKQFVLLPQYKVKPVPDFFAEKERCSAKPLFSRRRAASISRLTSTHRVQERAGGPPLNRCERALTFDREPARVNR